MYLIYISYSTQAKNALEKAFAENLSENYRTELIQIVAVGMQAIKNFDLLK